MPSELLLSFSSLAQASGDAALLATVLRTFRRCRVPPDSELERAAQAAGAGQAPARADGLHLGAGALFGSYDEVTRFLQSRGAEDRRDSGDWDEEGGAAADTASVARSLLSEATTAAAGDGARDALSRDVIGDGGAGAGARARGVHGALA